MSHHRPLPPTVPLLDAIGVQLLRMAFSACGVDSPAMQKSIASPLFDFGRTDARWPQQENQEHSTFHEAFDMKKRTPARPPRVGKARLSGPRQIRYRGGRCRLPCTVARVVPSQTVENQLPPLQEAAGRLGWTVVAGTRELVAPGAATAGLDWMPCSRASSGANATLWPGSSGLSDVVQIERPEFVEDKTEPVMHMVAHCRETQMPPGGHSA